jgi:hypothetical protein
MTREEFITLIGAYGADADRWPEATRDDALQFMAMNGEAASLAEPQQALDRLLDTGNAATSISAATMNAILDIPSHTRQRKPRRWALGLELSFMVPRLAGMAAMALVGFYIGLSDLVVLPSPETELALYDLTYLVFDTLPQENT